MQASLIDFDDLLDPAAADAAQVTDNDTGTHQQQQEGSSPAAAADVSHLWASTASAEHLPPHLAASSDPFIDFMHPGQLQPQQAGQQHAAIGEQQQQTVLHGQHHAPAVQEQQQQQQQQQQQPKEQHHTEDAKGTQPAAGSAQQLQPGQHPDQQHSSPQGTPCSSIDPSLLPVCERVACLGLLLQQHGAAQGEANASIRLLLATISAKQVKTRQLLAGISAAHASPSQQQQQPEQQQQLQQAQQAQQQLQQQLADSRTELAAARAELEAARAQVLQLKAAEAEQTELQFMREAEMRDLRSSEQQAHAEIQGLQERLLEAEEALSRLSASLPGNRGRRRHSNADAAVADLDFDFAGVTNVDAAASPLAGSSAAAAAASAFAADAAAAAAAGEAGLVTPVRGMRQQQLTQRSSLMTPDQQSIVQLKGWLQQSQAALIEAQEDLLAREAQVKELQRQQELAVVQLQAQLQQEQGDVAAAAAEQLLQQQRELVEVRGALQEAHQAAESAAAQRDEVREQLDEIRAELSSLKGQLQRAEVARAAGVAAVQEGMQQQGVDSAEAADAAAATAAAERAAAAEAELVEARAAAEAAAAEAAGLQQQLKQLQVQLQEQQAAAAAAGSSTEQPVAANAAADAAAADAAGQCLPSQQMPSQETASSQLTDKPATADASQGTQDATDQQPQEPQTKQQQQQGISHDEGSVGFELLKAVSEKQALQEELADTKQRLLLLLQLVKKAAAAAAASGSTRKQQQLPTDLDGLLEEPAAAAGVASSGGAASNGDPAAAAATDDAAGAAGDVGELLQLALGLEARYCRPEQLQQLLLRGMEMQLLLENALQQVHLIKAAAGVASCACPSEQEYQQLRAAARIAEGKSSSDSAVAAVPSKALGLGDVPGAASAPYSGDSAAAAAAAAAEHSGMGLAEQWDQPVHDGEGQGLAGTDARMLTGGGYEPDPFDLLLQQPQQTQQQQQQGGAAGNGGGAGAYVGSSCGSDVLRVGAAVGSGQGVLDEGLSYDGLEGAWWNKSSVESVTDLPDFLIKKS